ncbi:MAG TPA: hypothetical protein VNX28_01215 [Gemmataceae bacterium]|jgi:hypothetical protein|nr:hypothetical protein [Gemmataceae bacterium]
MFFSRWLRAKNRSGRTRDFRPALDALEDRTLPSGFGFHFLPPPGPAATLLVEVPNSVQSGTPFTVKVEALDSANHLATGYAGTVTLSLGTADANATVPAAYTFLAADHGEHFFKVTLAATGSQTIDASGTPPSGTTAITGSAGTTVLPAPTLANLLVVTPEQAAVGVPASVKVEALDGSGHLLKNFTGTVTLSTSDTAATGLPATYTFTAPNGGTHTFQVTFETGVAAGTPTTVTATDGTVTNQAALTVYPATTVTHFGIESAGIFATKGNQTPVTVVALNAANQPVTGYLGTVSFSSPDTTATTASTKDGTYTSLGTFSYTFLASDNGSHRFYINFDAGGMQSLTVTDTAANLSATTQIWVTNLPPWRHWWW